MDVPCVHMHPHTVFHLEPGNPLETCQMGIARHECILGLCEVAQPAPNLKHPCPHGTT